MVGGAGTGRVSVQIKEGRPAKGEQKTWSGPGWLRGETIEPARQEEPGVCVVCGSQGSLDGTGTGTSALLNGSVAGCGSWWGLAHCRLPSSVYCDRTDMTKRKISFLSRLDGIWNMDYDNLQFGAMLWNYLSNSVSDLKIKTKETQRRSDERNGRRHHSPLTGVLEPAEPGLGPPAPPFSDRRTWDPSAAWSGRTVPPSRKTSF